MHLKVHHVKPLKNFFTIITPFSIFVNTRTEKAMNNFLETLRNNCPTSFIDYLQTDKEKFYSCLIEEWAEEQLQRLKGQIQQQASHGDYSISNDKKIFKNAEEVKIEKEKAKAVENENYQEAVYSEDLSYLTQQIIDSETGNDKKIIEGTYKTISTLTSSTISGNHNNTLLKDFSMKELFHFFDPKFVKVSTRTERQMVGFFKIERVDYIDYKLEISNLAKRALKRLGELALEQGICLKKIGFSDSQVNLIMFDNMFELSKLFTFSYRGGNYIFNYEFFTNDSCCHKELFEDDGIRFSSMFIEYLVSF